MWNYDYIKGVLNRTSKQYDTWKEFYEELKVLTSEIHEYIPETLEDLENEFRELLGVNET